MIIKSYLGHEHRAVDRDRVDLEAGERSEEDLHLVRVLREPSNVGAAVDHPLAH